MSSSVELVLLKCPQCSTPVPAEEDEVAWVCATCGLGLQLTEAGLAPLTVHWSAGRTPQAAWLPFWVFTGTVRFSARESYSGRADADSLWAQPRSFYVPAFVVTLPQLEALGGELTRRQLPLHEGPAAGLVKQCTLLPEDARRAAEFIVTTLEADRKDILRNLSFTLDLGQPELWMLPFEGGSDVRNLIS